MGTHGHGWGHGNMGTLGNVGIAAMTATAADAEDCVKRSGSAYDGYFRFFVRSACWRALARCKFQCCLSNSDVARR